MPIETDDEDGKQKVAAAKEKTAYETPELKDLGVVVLNTKTSLYM